MTLGLVPPIGWLASSARCQSLLVMLLQGGVLLGGLAVGRLILVQVGPQSLYLQLFFGQLNDKEIYLIRKCDFTQKHNYNYCISKNVYLILNILRIMACN